MLNSQENVENTSCRRVFSTFPWCYQMSIVFYHSEIHSLGFVTRCVSMSGSRTGFPKYALSGCQNYFLQISVNNVKPCLQVYG